MDSKSEIKLNEKETNDGSSSSMNFSQSSVESEINENTVVKVENRVREENIQRVCSFFLVGRFSLVNIKNRSNPLRLVDL